MARKGAFRSLAAGTALAGLMGVGAVVVARSYGISNVQQFGDEIKRWLPTKEELQDTVQPKLEPLQRTITEHVQGGRATLERKIQNSSLGKDIAARSRPKAETELEPWEKELLAKLEAPDKPTTPK